MSASAVEAGALAVTSNPSDAHRLQVLLPSSLCATSEATRAWKRRVAACAGLSDPSSIEFGAPEELWEPDDWDAAACGTFRPLLVGGSLLIEPLVRTEEPAAPAGAQRIRLLDSEFCFLTTTAGTVHWSTAMMLELLLSHRARLGGAACFLDYGCGSAVLALAALALGGPALRAYATDVNDAAIGAARRNGLLNAIEGGRLVVETPWELPSTLDADVAAANMLPGPLISVAPDLAARVREGGLLFITGFREADRQAVTDAFTPFFDVPPAATLARGGWLALACRRRDAGSGVSLSDLSDSAVE